MEQAEPTFVPEWYKGASAGSHHHSWFSSHSDEHGEEHPSKNRLPVSGYDHEAPRLSAFTNRNSSAFNRSANSNGSASHDKDSSSRSRPYSSFGRSHRDRDREKDLDVRDREMSFMVDDGVCQSFKLSRTEKENLRRSHSMISGRHVESWPKRPGTGLSNGVHSAASMAGGISKSSFEREFPSLRTEELQGFSDVSRVASIGPSTAIHSLPVGSSAMDGDVWTSALVEPPAKVGGTGVAFISASSAAVVNMTSAVLSTGTGLNMAEALTQTVPRACNAPQLTVDTQRIEELTRIQYSKLIPVTPPTPKSSVLNSSDKSKLKASKSGEISAPVKVAQQSSSHIINQAVRAPYRSDTPKTSQAGNFQVLNRERNGISSLAKEVANTNGTKSLAPVSGVASAAPPQSPMNPKIKADNKGGVLASSTGPSGEKRSLSQAQKRSDFFNTLRKKAAVNQSAILPESSCVASPCNSNKLSLQAKEMSSDSQETINQTSKSGLDYLVENEKEVLGGCIAHEERERFVSDDLDESFCSESVDPDEEEAAFLRSLGWDENAGVEALTAEEINAFFKEYEKLRPSSKPSHS